MRAFEKTFCSGHHMTVNDIGPSSANVLYRTIYGSCRTVIGLFVESELSYYLRLRFYNAELTRNWLVNQGLALSG
jgi:hypothetical protein